MNTNTTFSTIIKSLDDVHNYHKTNLPQWESVLDCLEHTLTSARDNKDVPIYLTKGRIKQPESAYLKFKRKERNNPNLITDWIGFRVLCLFQQDLYIAFNYIFELLINKQKLHLKDQKAPINHFEINEVIIFNWPADRSSKLIESIKKSLSENKSKTIKSVADGVDIAFTYTDNQNKEHVISFKVRKETRGSGYQSVHFVSKAHNNDNSTVSCEIQLRTLLQDVWGELEHALSYKKGKIHPHISNSFELLSTELHAKDELVSQLRDIRDQETALVRYSSRSAGPSRWLSYPDEITKKLSENTKTAIAEFGRHCSTRRNCKSLDEWTETANHLKEKITLQFTETSQESSYISLMENAFLMYSTGNLAAAEKFYEEAKISEFGLTQWFPLFRLGEIYLAQEKIGDALVAFDQAEDRMKKATGGELDRYYAKIGLAYSYWSLGKEFLPTAIKKTEEGAEFIKKHLSEDQIQNDDQISVNFSIANNLCFYYLEHWINTPSSAEVNEIHKRKHLAEKQYKNLKELVEKYPENTFSNYLDTLAWYCYHAAQKSSIDSEKSDWLSLAFGYVQRVEQSMNRAPSRVISNSIQREHMQQILSTYMRQTEG